MMKMRFCATACLMALLAAIFLVDEVSSQAYPYPAMVGSMYPMQQPMNSRFVGYPGPWKNMYMYPMGSEAGRPEQGGEAGSEASAGRNNEGGGEGNRGEGNNEGGNNEGGNNGGGEPTMMSISDRVAGEIGSI